MARRNRRDEIDESVVGAYLVTSRTVRRAFLTGVDPQTGRDHSYRKEQIERRLETLAGIFAIDICDHAVLENHFYAILRNRPDVVAQWSDEEVARRWLRVERSALELREEPTAEQIAEFVVDGERVAKARARLSSISEFIGCLKEPIARVANLMDRCSGCFWQGRFKSRRLRNEIQFLAISLYVNLDAFRAGKATWIDDSEHTSNHARLQDRATGDADRKRSGWLSPVHVDGDGYDGTVSRRRASNNGYLNVTFVEYLELLEAVARREQTEREDGTIDRCLPVLKRLGVSAAQWEETVLATSRLFARELAIMGLMAEEAQRHN